MPVEFIVVMNRIPALIAAVEAQGRRAPKKVADKIAQTARTYAPYDTGFLRSSITTVSTEAGKTAEVQVGADYAGYVEYGTRFMAAQPFLEPAVQAHQEDLNIEFKGFFDGF